jgi:hypothetical protein
MTFGRDERDVPEGRRRRPRLMTLLTLLMLILGGRMFFSSVTDLHRLISGRPEVLHLDGGLDAQQEALLRGQIVLGNSLSHHRPQSLAVHAVGRLALGLIYLFAVAAVFLGDARGRRASLLAAWAGIVVCLGNAAFVQLVVRPMVPWLLPTLAEAFAQDAARAGRALPVVLTVEEQAHLFLVDVPLVVTGMGMVFSLLLLLYFRGRQARLFYNQPRQTDHG